MAAAAHEGQQDRRTNAGEGATPDGIAQGEAGLGSASVPGHRGTESRFSAVGKRSGQVDEGVTVVTGAGGFIGNAVSRRLVAAGREVRGVEASAAAAGRVRDAGAELVFADVTDPDAMRAALENASALVHTAAIVSDAGAMADHVRVNVGGTSTTLGAAAALGIERRLHVSSVVVYGFDDPSTQDEDAHLRNSGVPYIDTKSAADRVARRLDAIVVRPGDVYGPGSVPWSVRPLQLAKAGQLAVPSGDARQMLPVYIDDLVEAIVLALDRGEPGQAYAAWKDDEPVTFEEHFNAFAEMSGGRRARRLPRPLIRTAGRLGEVVGRATGSPPTMTRHSVDLIDRRGSVSAGRLRELGWAPSVSHAEGMRRTEAWLRAEGLL